MTSYNVGLVLCRVGQIAAWISPPSRRRPLGPGASAHPTRPGQCPPKRAAAALDVQAALLTAIVWDKGAHRQLRWPCFSTRGGTRPSTGSSRKVCRGLSLPCAPLVVPAPHAPPGYSAVPQRVHPASTAENHAALSRHHAGSLPHPPTKGARGRRGRGSAAQRRAEHGVGRVLVPSGSTVGQHTSGVAVDVRGGAEPPSSACAHSTYWTDCNRRWRV